MNHAKTFPTREAAERSKRFLSGGCEPRFHEPCSGYHLEPTAKPAPAPKRPQAGDTFSPAVARRITLRDGCCQRCGSASGLHKHHRRGKGKGGSSRRQHTHCACNGILLCWRCHHWAHVTGRRQAEAEGYIVSQSVDEPGTAGVMRFAAAEGGATHWPTCGGEWANSAAEAREAVA